MAGFAFFEKRRVAIVKVLEFHPNHLLTDEPFDGLDVARILSRHQGKCVAGRLCAPGPANAMDIVLGMLGHVIVNDVTYVGYIQPARRNIRSDKHFETPLPEAFERLFALPLGPVGMQYGHRMAISFEQAGNAIRAVLGTTKNDYGVVVNPF